MNNYILSEARLYHEVDRCLYCQEKPCKDACPVGCSPADFIRAIASKEASDFLTASKIIMGSNPLGGVCGAVCPDWFCMKACSRKLFDYPINIPAIQATIIEKAKQIGMMPKFEKAKPNNHKIAIIGAGPAGLGCAAVLLQLGYKVDMFEKETVGGALNYIPDFRLDKKIIQSDIEFIKSLGNIEIHTKTEIKEKDIEKIISRYDAVVIAVGVGKQISLNIPNEDKAIKGIDFLKNINKYNIRGKKVAISGGGAVAFDCAITATLKGAKSVEIHTRKNMADIQISKREIDEIFKFKININSRSKIKEIITKNRKIIGAVFCRVDEKGNEIKNSQRFEEIDIVILAIKNESEFSLKNKEGIFFCGDCIEGSSTVVEAVASGKNCALEIDNYLKNKKMLIRDRKKSNYVLNGRNMINVDLSVDFFGYKMKSPFMISASPHSDGFKQVKIAYENGWPGVIMKTAFDGVHIHIPSEYMFIFDELTYGNSDNVSEHPLDKVCKEIEKLRKLYPDRLTGASTGGPVTGDDEKDKKVWQSNTKKLENAGAMVIEYSLSCPQGGDGTKGDIVSQDPQLSAKIIDWVMQVSDPDIPKLFKLTAAVTSITQVLNEIKKVFEKYPSKKAGITLANSFPALGFRKSDEKRKWDEGVVIGLSGRGIAPISYLTVAKAVNSGIFISANGGAMDWKMAANFLAMGARNVQFCTILMKYGFDIINHLEWGIASMLEKNGYKTVEDFIGIIKNNIITPFDELSSVKKIPDVIKDLCIHCAGCTTCGYLAVELDKNKIPHFNSNRCIGCSICVKKCPSAALYMRKRRKDEIQKK